jgi:hypothetical protein
VVRDVPFIMTKGFVEYGWKFPFRFTWQLAQKLFTLDVWKVIATGDYTKAKNPHIREFFEGGGNTGYSTIPDINKLKKAANGWDKKTTISWQDIGDVVSYLNTFSEVWTRLAAYSAVRSLNGTKEDGIRAAKNLSVNFNRRGLGHPIMNTFNSISFFANAAIQGASGFYRSFHTNKPNKVSKFAQGFRATAGFMFAPAMVGYLATILTPDDDEGLMWYSDYERDNYVLFGEKRIPLNEQLKPFWVVGVNMALVTQGRRTMEQALNSVMSAFFTNLVPAAPNINTSLVMATNAIIGTRDYTASMIIENMIVPQSMSNISDLSHNVSFMGSKLRYDMGDMPEYLQGENEALMYREIARLFYEWGGGDTNLPSKHREVLNDDGTISYEKIKFGDKNPREIEAFMSIVIPSTFRDFGNLVTGVIKRDFGEATDYTSVKRFYNPREKEMTMYQIIREAKDLVKDYEDQMSNYKKHLAGAGLSNNQDKQDKAEARINNIIGNGEIINIKELVDGYEALSIYTYSKQFGMTEKQFIKELEINKPASAKAFKKMNGVPREEIVRKILTLMRQYKGMDVKNSNLKEE